ncbi:MAG: acetyl/propionyl/methylcrotonyl-CoA carboxylase subunit alpha, partial [Burkholderiaceae bacterium]
IIASAKAAKAGCIHPGYGFLSENPDFAQACADAGIVFIGPPADAIRAMGSKSAAKALMERAGVPLVPGYHGDEQASDFLQAQADAIGYPVLIKASAGGGGKGMRIVERAEDFAAALASCRREAAASFGSDRVLIEKYLTRPRHIEIQVFGDGHGRCIALFERDCSVQRRHQKVLEEAPAPGMAAARREAMGAAAVAAAQAVGYVGAGTVEFIVDTTAPDAPFYFMEMNTRLQVEHPVTEMITGLDLVAWQLRVAAGEPLSALMPDGMPAIRGHAIEARIYAENPEAGFLPSTGTLRALQFPPAVAFTIGADPGEPAPVRVDSGVRQGDAITPFYDPMIAKLIAWGPDRATALARLRAALAACRIVGEAPNVAFLHRLAGDPAFADADLDTGLIERRRDALFPPPQPASPLLLALAAVSLLAPQTSQTLAAGWPDPWARSSGWRMNGTLRRRIEFETGGEVRAVEIDYAGDAADAQEGQEGRWHCRIDDAAATLTLLSRDGDDLRIAFGERTAAGTVLRDGDALYVFAGGAHTVLTLVDPLAHAGAAHADVGRLTAPMPGRIVAITVEPGQTVARGAPLLVMEAMKMEHTIAAPADGTVDALLYGVGDQVAEGAQLLSFSASA